ncbi:MmcQ/YjbR family DNA-binding protein [Humidisolicoccus flavus]|uniref:MmcQ/YjbR family DNA-binding protein n=1 Tax=Humidisolicoccus flavus TaxID=3111414 RepID=UPI00324669A4
MNSNDSQIEDDEALFASSIELQDFARACANDLPHATLDHPFGAESDVFRIISKIFMIVSDAKGEPVITVKAEPTHVSALIQQFSSIAPGYHMSKSHWVSVQAGEGITRGLVAELVTNAYLVVIEGLPRAKRPVLPDHLNSYLR